MRWWYCKYKPSNQLQPEPISSLTNFDPWPFTISTIHSTTGTYLYIYSYSISSPPTSHSNHPLNTSPTIKPNQPASHFVFNQSVDLSQSYLQHIPNFSQVSIPSCQPQPAPHPQPKSDIALDVVEVEVTLAVITWTCTPAVVEAEDNLGLSLHPRILPLLMNLFVKAIFKIHLPHQCLFQLTWQLLMEVSPDSEIISYDHDHSTHSLPRSSWLQFIKEPPAQISVKQASVKSSPKGKAKTKNPPPSEEADESEICFICAEPVRYYALGVCSHRTCHICAIRMRALYKKLDCTYCKVSQETIPPIVLLTFTSCSRLDMSLVLDRIAHRDLYGGSRCTICFLRHFQLPIQGSPSIGILRNISTVDWTIRIAQVQLPPSRLL